MPCSNAAKTRNPLKFAGVPQTGNRSQPLVGSKFTILSGHVEEVLVFNKLFPIVDTCLNSEDIARQSRAMVPKWRFLRPVFPASRVQHISHVHSKYSQKSHTMCGSTVDIQAATAEIRRGKERKKEEKSQGKFIIVFLLT